MSFCKPNQVVKFVNSAERSTHFFRDELTLFGQSILKIKKYCKIILICRHWESHFLNKYVICLRHPPGLTHGTDILSRPIFIPGTDQALQHYKLQLRGSHITIFLSDRVQTPQIIALQPTEATDFFGSFWRSSTSPI